MASSDLVPTDKTFDTGKFTVYSLSLGLPFVILAVLGAYTLHKFHWKPSRINAWMSQKTWGWLEDSKKWHMGVRFAPFLFLFVVWGIPSVLLIVWGSLVSIKKEEMRIGVKVIAKIYPPLAGWAILLLGLMCLFLLFGWFRWKAAAWRMDRVVSVLLVSTASCLFALLLVASFTVPKFDFSGASYVFLAFNMVFIVNIVYQKASGEQAEFVDFADDAKDEDAPTSDHKDAQVSRHSKAYVWINLGGAIGVLLIYAILMIFVPGLPSKWIGFIVAANVLGLDIIVMLYHRAGLIHRPMALIMLLTACRAALVAWGPRYWFLGSASVFLAWSLVLGERVVSIKYPPLDNKDKKRQALGSALHGVAAKEDEEKGDDGGEAKKEEEEAKESDDESVSPFGVKFSIPDGSLGSSDWTRSPITIWGVLLVLFVIELIVVVVAASYIEKVHVLQGSHNQWVFGLFSLTLSLILPALVVFYRIYKENEWVVNGRVTKWLVGVEAAFLASGGVLWGADGSPVPFIISAFLPLILLLMSFSYLQWKINDYDLMTPNSPRGVEYFKTFFKRELPKEDYLLVLYNVLIVGLCLGMGSAISATMKPSWVGWTMATLLYLPMLSLATWAKWFNTLQKSLSLFGLMFANVIVIVLYGILMYTGVKWTSKEGVALLYVCIGYLVLWLAMAAISQLREDGWKLKGVFVPAALGICVLGIITLIVVLFFVDAFIAGALCFVIVAAVYVIFIVRVWRKNGFWLPKKYRMSVGALMVLVVGFGVYIGVFRRSFFIGFSLCWAMLFILAMGTTVREMSKNAMVLYSRNILPVLLFDLDRDDVVDHNRPVFLVYGTLFISGFWGILAAVFLSPPYIGLGITSFVLLMVFVYTKSRRRATSLRYAKSVEFVTKDLLRDAKRHATESQLHRDRPVAETIEGLEEEEGDAEAPKQAEKTLSLADLLLEKETLIDTVFASEPDPVKAKAAMQRLVEVDEEIRRAHYLQMRFEAHFQLLVMSKAEAARRKEHVTLNRFLRQIGRADLTAEDIAGWSPEDREKFREELAEYKRKRKEEQEKLRLAREQDEEAARRRRGQQDALRRKREEEERKRKDALKLEEEKALRKEEERRREEARRKEEEAHKKAEEAEAEAERRRMAGEEEAAKEAERRAEEVRRKMAEAKAAEEARRKKLEDKEAERKRKEEEERKKKVAEQGGGGGGDGGEGSAMVEKIIEKCRESGVPFTDEEFPPSNDSLWGGPKPHDAVEIDEWKRVSEICKGDPTVFAEKVDPGDIAQGALGDCWFLSALSVMATKPDLLMDVFITKEPNDAGVYAVRFHRDGETITVLVDDKIPVHRNRAAYARCTQPNELWVMLLEKAYAKLHSNYKAIEGGLVSIALADLTGGTADEVDMQSDKARREIESGALWKRMMEYQEASYLLGAGSHSGSDRNTSAEGIVQGHAYSILRLVEIDGNHLLQLRNPWGRGEWKGDWSDGDDYNWTKRMKAKLGYVNADDGAFWMCFEDFVEHFRNIYVCRIFGDKWNRVQLRGGWKGDTAGGCTNFPSAMNNPQYGLALKRPTHLFFSLTQTEVRGQAGKELFHMGLKVVDKEGCRVKNLYRGEEVGNTGSYVNRREVSCELRLQPKDYPYTLFPSVFKPGWETGFTLTVYSDFPVELKLLDPSSVEAT